MTLLALQMRTDDPAFWTMVMTIIIAASFLVIAAAMVVMALVVRRVVRAVSEVERRVEPLFERVAGLTDQVRQIASEGKVVAEQAGLISTHLSTASLHFSESLALVRDEVRELKELVGVTAETARDKVEMISRSIDQTHDQLMVTTDFITGRILSPARELAAIMVGLRRGLEVLVAPTPKPIDRTYGEEEMFIG
jgi:uncharacterized protein YoxC